MPVSFYTRQVLYLDVTSSCKSPLNTGIQRMVRGLYAGLSRRLDVTPLLWSPRLNSYCRLSDHERRFLIEPFARHHQASATPETLAAPFPWSKTLRLIRHHWHRFPLEEVARPTDILFVPEIFQDNRIARFRTIKSWFPGRRYAVFHDAIALRLPEHTALTRQQHYADYVSALADFHKVVCISREVEDDLRFYWSSFQKPATLTCVLGWPTDFGQARPKPHPNFAARRVLCVATLDRRKNHLKLLQAAELLWSKSQQFELVLVGRTTADWGATVLREVTRLTKLGRPLKWLQHVTDAELHQAYRRCSFTVYPSLREGFGLPVLESLWHHRPCVCSFEGAIGEIAAGGGCHAANPADPASLAKAMHALLSNESAYRHLCLTAAGRKLDSWDDYMAQLLHEISPPDAGQACIQVAVSAGVQEFPIRAPVVRG